MTGVLAWSCAISTVTADRGTLHADGVLSVKGAREGRARVTVMPMDKPAYMLPQGLSRFVLDLELDNTFLITFEQEGCVTKELYFDTTVPVEQHTAEFSFPFKVTLEDHGHAGAFTYAGPVGFIRYHAEITDFGYETDYTIKVDDSFHQRMAVLKSTGTDPKLAIAMPLAAKVVTTSYHRPGEAAPEPEVSIGEGTLAPIKSEVPRLVHRTGGDATAFSVVADAPAPAPVVVEVIEPVAVNIVPVIEEPVLAIPTPKIEPVRAAPPEVIEASVPAVVPVVVDRPAVTPVVPGLGAREEQLIVERNRVITIVRIIHPDGHATEYRRVQHRYGAIFFFKDGLSVPEHMYSDGTVAGAQNL